MSACPQTACDIHKKIYRVKLWIRFFLILAVRGWHFLCCWKFLEGGQSPQIEGSVEACPPFLVYNKINRKRVCLQTACDIDKKIHRVKLCNLSKKWFWLGGVNIFCASGYFWGVDRTLKHLKKLSQRLSPAADNTDLQHFRAKHGFEKHSMEWNGI